MARSHHARHVPRSVAGTTHASISAMMLLAFVGGFVVGVHVGFLWYCRQAARRNEELARAVQLCGQWRSVAKRAIERVQKYES